MDDPGPDARPARPTLPLVLAIAVTLAGVVWILQGLGVLSGGSFMVGDPRWAVIGAAAFVLGAIFTAQELRRR